MEQKIPEKKLRILFVTNNYTPYSGGVVSSITAIADQLHALGHKVFIVTLQFLKTGHHDPYYVFRVPCPIIFTYKKNPMAVPLRAYAFIQKQIALLKPDIIHVHHPILLGDTACSLAKKHAIPIVFTYHSLYEQYVHYIPLPQWLTRPLVINRVIKFCHSVDGIIAPSTSVAAFLQKNGVCTPTTIIPSPLSPLFITPSYTQKTKRNPIKLLCVSRFAKEKNLTLLLDVIHLLPAHTYHLTLVGYGAEYEHLQNYALNTKKLSPEQVSFIIRPSKQHLQKLYQDAHLFLFPSTTDTQGLVLAEAMSQGTPIIALDGPGQRDIILSGKNGFIVHNKEHMAQVIKHIIEDQQEYDALCAHAHVTARTYHPALLVNTLLTFYAHVLGL